MFTKNRLLKKKLKVIGLFKTPYLNVIITDHIAVLVQPNAVQNANLI